MLTLEEAAEKIIEAFDTKEISLESIWNSLPVIMDFVEKFENLSGSEKKDKALKIMNLVLSKVELPGWDWLSRRALMYIFPWAIDTLVEASKGKYNF